jgi:hypothetical protein
VSVNQARGRPSAVPIGIVSLARVGAAPLGKSLPALVRLFASSRVVRFLLIVVEESLVDLPLRLGTAVFPAVRFAPMFLRPESLRC